MIPFAEAAPPVEIPNTVKLDGYNMIRVPVEPGKLDWLCSIRIDCDGPLEHIELREPNGAPIFTMSGETFARLDNTIPIEFDDTGRGCLSNLSRAAGYLLVVVGNGTATITCTGRPLPGPDAHRVPPGAGTLQMWNEILNIVMAGGRNRISMNRVGNIIAELWLTFKDRDGALIDVDDLYLAIDVDRRLPEEPEQIAPGVYRYVFDSGLQTVIRTILEAYFEAPCPGTLSWTINDVCDPTPFHLPRRRSTDAKPS
jgi:hypothetical protein